MRITDLDEAVGRIVKGVNTTKDVGVDEIKKQAAKFGNKVDRDGRPPTLSKKIRGSSTNVLYNLGLSERKFTEYELAIMEGGHSLEDLRDDTRLSLSQHLTIMETAKRTKFSLNESRVITAYHRIPEKITSIDRTKLQSSDSGWAGIGMYFTPEKPLHDLFYGVNVLEVKLHLDNPFILTDEYLHDPDYNPYNAIPNAVSEFMKEGFSGKEAYEESSRGWTEFMLDEGYDSFIGGGTSGTLSSEIVVFDQPGMERKIEIIGNS